MRTYLVTIRKLVPDGCGHDHRALQKRVVVAARSDVAAAYAAKAMFCEAVGILDWRLRADTCDVVELPKLAA